MSGIYIPWLAEAALMTGYKVVEVKDWRTRGHGGFRVVEGVVLHHTAGPRSGNYPSLNVVTNGRVGLKGPLSNYGIGRDGTIYVIAAGVCWHAGASKWAGFLDLNDEFIGIEAESTGTSDDWTPAQRDVYPRLVAACLHYMRRTADRAAGHKEIAPGRKIDPAFWDLNGVRRTVASYLGNPNSINKFKAQPATSPNSNPNSNSRTGTKKHMILQDTLYVGNNYGRIICPVDEKEDRISILFSRGWVSVSARGGGMLHFVGFQKNAPEDIPPPGAGPIWNGRIRNASRVVKQLPDKTEFIEYNIEVYGPKEELGLPAGKITVELEAK